MTLYQETFKGTQAEFIASRVAAKTILSFRPEEISAALKQDQLTPVALALQLGSLSLRTASAGVSRLLEANPFDIKERPSRVTPLERVLVGGIEGFVRHSAGDLVSATLSIPRMPQEDALQITRDPRSQQGVRHFALSPKKHILEIPGDTTYGPVGPELSDYADPLLCYYPILGHITTGLDPVGDSGCPVAKAKGRLIEDLFLLMSEVTIRKVEWPAGVKYYPS